MQVILLERVPKLGLMGDIVTVKEGFGRNYLLPQGKALRATESNKKAFEGRKVALEADNLKRKEEAAHVAKKIEGLVLYMVRQASEKGQLYGSVTPKDIASAITAEGFTVDRRQVHAEPPIRTVGVHTVPLYLHPEVAVDIRLNVAQTLEEAKALDKTLTAAEETQAIEAAVEADLNAAFGTDTDDQPENA